ncbi:MAG: hypothetical protein M3Y08_05460 [Fibrobacterota bacterium]|nr:hypothetical protein [Fibrobacterota bacterium]
MNSFNFSGGAFKGLLVGGLMAGALGLAYSDQGSKRGSDDQTMGQSQTDQYGIPSQQGTGQSGTSTLGGTGATGAGAAMLPPNVTPGWKIRVCSEKTKATNINFKISSADKGVKAKGSAGSGKMGSETGAMGSGQTGTMGSGQGGASGSETGSMGRDNAQATDLTGATGTPGTTDPTATGGVGTTGAAGEQTAMWSQGEPTVISLPAELQNVERLRIEAVPGEKDRNASVCVLYNDHVAKKMNFDDRQVSTVKSTEKAECGC